MSYETNQKQLFGFSLSMYFGNPSYVNALSNQTIYVK